MYVQLETLPQMNDVRFVEEFRLTSMLYSQGKKQLVVAVSPDEHQYSMF